MRMFLSMKSETFPVIRHKTEIKYYKCNRIPGKLQIVKIMVVCA